MMFAMQDEIVITTGARLHFGFFAHRPLAGNITTRTNAASSDGLLERANYGGIGLMIASPGFVLAASRSDCDRITCPDHPTPGHASGSRSSSSTSQFDLIGRRVAHLVDQYRRSCPSTCQPPTCAIEIRRIVPPHNGLGSGTQLAMAVSQALALLSANGQAASTTLAQRVARGKRSAIGIHGFARGGFLVDAGKTSTDDIGRLVVRADTPGDWRFLLVTPADSSGTGLSGQEEVDALERLPEMPLSLTERLCRLALLEMLPALGDANSDRFGEAMFEFGHSVGEYFRPVQGDAYADSRMADLVHWLRRQGVHGIAQTSWGPTIAICCGDEERAKSLQDRILADSRWPDCQAYIASPLNTGAAIQF
jgi:beta-RFAP synthase